MITIHTCTVRILRSHDYCHFEVTLGSNGDRPITLEDVDALRKEAARLADKAVDQYKIAKENFAAIDHDRESRRWERENVKRLEEIPEGERTPETQARIKAFRDAEFESRRRYDYEDDFEDDFDDDDE